jgi:AcrR family transcriptional regulator
VSNGDRAPEGHEGSLAADSALAARRPRSDRARNRERLVEAAKAAFADLGAEVSLEEVARRAGVGIATLYRHFPTRRALLEAVYRREVEQLAAAATRLLASDSPRAALREWLYLAVDYIATKKLIAPALAASAGGVDAVYAASGPMIMDAVTMLVERAVAAGEIRPEVEAGDLLRVMVGLSYGQAEAGWEASARRLVDILMDGLLIR